MEKIIICTADGIEVSGIPDEIKILPLGTVHSQKGNFLVDEKSFEAIRQAFKGRNVDLVIDYEHQTLADIQAPAAGWIKDIRLGEDAIIAKVEWTQKGGEYLKNREYRYVSPVVMVRKKDSRATALHSMALTNTPAIDGMFPIVAHSLDIENMMEDDDGGNKMELEKIRKLLGLQEGATEEDVLKALETAGVKKKEEGGTEGQESDKKEATSMVANSTILGLLGLQEDAGTEEVAASILSLKNGDISMKTEFLALKERVEKKEAEEAVQVALRTGKITAAQKEWATEYALKNLEGFRKFTELAPQTVPVGKLDTVDAPKKSLTDEDVMILKTLGLDDEKIKTVIPGKEN